MLARVVDASFRSHLEGVGLNSVYLTVPARGRARLRAPPEIRAGVPDEGVLTQRRLSGGALACASQQTESELRTRTRRHRRCRNEGAVTVTDTPDCSATAECKGGTLTSGVARGASAKFSGR